MIKEEWKKLGRNKFLILAILVIALIPTMYGTIFLASMWDPYGQVNKLPIAVVNQDRTVNYNGKTLNVGSDLVARLKKEKPLNCNYVSAATAAAGLRDRTYYMIITIPENFSKNATTLLDNSPQKMELNYRMNSGSNLIASKICTAATDKITSKVMKEVTKTYADTLFDKVKDVKSGFSAATNGAQKIDNGVKSLQQPFDLFRLFCSD